MNLDELESIEPTQTDFRRAGRGVPLIRNEATGKYERYRRSSSAGKILDDETGLTDWRIRTILVGAAQRPDLMALVSTLDSEGDKGRIRDYAEDCLVTGKGTQRRETGTAVHAMLDFVDRKLMGDAVEWTPAPQFAESIEAYENVRDAYGLVPVDIECRCVNDEFRLAGTMDRRYRTTRLLTAPDGTVIPVGTILAGDTKTGRKLEHASGTYATQLAAYVGSVRYDVVTDEREPFDPPTDEYWAVIVHLDWEHSTCELHWVDLSAGRLGLELAARVYEWRRRSDLISPARAPIHAVPADTPPEVPTMPVGARCEEPPPVASPMPDEATAGLVAEWLRERVRDVVAAGDEATFYLQRIWPAGVPGLKNEGHSLDQLDAIAVAVSIVEKEFSLPFPRLDPRKVASDAWAKPSQAQGDGLNADDLLRSIHGHPRRALLLSWSGLGMSNLDPDITDRKALTHALYEFALVNDEWSDEDVTEMLDGSLRAIGYAEGIHELGRVIPDHAPLIMSAAFALRAETAMLMYGEDGKAIVRVIGTAQA